MRPDRLRATKGRIEAAAEAIGEILGRPKPNLSNIRPRWPDGYSEQEQAMLRNAAATALYRAAKVKEKD